MNRRAEIHDLAQVALRDLGEAMDRPEGKKRQAAIENATLHAHEALSRIRYTTKLEEGWRTGPLW